MAQYSRDQTALDWLEETQERKKETILSQDCLDHFEKR